MNKHNRPDPSIPLLLTPLTACVGRPPNGDWEHVLWLPGHGRCWTVRGSE